MSSKSFRKKKMTFSLKQITFTCTSVLMLLDLNIYQLWAISFKCFNNNSNKQNCWGCRKHFDVLQLFQSSQVYISSFSETFQVDAWHFLLFTTHNKIYGTGENINPSPLTTLIVSFNFLGPFVPLLASTSFGKGIFTSPIFGWSLICLSIPFSFFLNCCVNTRNLVLHNRCTQ